MKKNILCAVLIFFLIISWAIADENSNYTEIQKELETIELPEVVTSIENQPETILSEAIPDFSLELPALSLAAPTLPESFFKGQGLYEETQDFLFSEREDKDRNPISEPIEMLGKVGIAYPFAFLGSASFYQQGTNPFKMEVDGVITNALGKKSQSNDFFVDTFSFYGTKELKQEEYGFVFDGRYDFVDAGLQNHSPLFISEKNQFALFSASYFYNLSNKTSLGVALKDDFLQQNLLGMKDSLFIGEQAFFNTVQTAIFWRYRFTENLILNVQSFYDFYANASQYIHGVFAQVFFEYKNEGLEASLQVTPGYRKKTFVYPFEGKLVFTFKPFDAVYDWKIAFEGGLRSEISDMYRLAKTYWYSYYHSELQEESDWFVRLVMAIPLADTLFFTGELDYKTTAFNRSALVVDYEHQEENGLFSFVYKNRSVLNSVLAVNYTNNLFELVMGWKSFWLYKDAHEFAQTVFLQGSYITEKKNSGVTGLCSFDFQKQGSAMPKIDLSLFYIPWANSKFLFGLEDIISLFTGKERFYAKPYCKKAGSVTFSMEFTY